MSSPGKPITICAGQDLLAKNRISELPDDLLFNIASYLPMKEAGRSSVLSKRWKHVWAYIRTLDFDSRKLMDNIWSESTILELEASKYLNWVDRVISSYKAPIIDEFRVQFDLTSVIDNFKDNIDNWLRFAMEKRVKMLEIDFSVYFGKCAPQYYTFPINVTGNSLTSLELGSVNVTGEILESFLCSCLALEYLSVKNSRSLEELTVASPLLKLKSLIIEHCFSLRKLEISAPNLVSFSYYGPITNVQFRSTPKLAEVSIGRKYADNLIRCFSDLTCYLTQIEVLTLVPCSSIERIIFPTEDLVFPKLGKLEVSVDVYVDDDLAFIGSLLKTCPSLHHFKLQLKIEERSRYERCRIPVPILHPHLKTVEIVGFCEKPIAMEIAVFLVETAVTLETLTIDPTQKIDVGSPWASEDTPEKVGARMHAQKIRSYLKPGTKLEIL